MSRRKVRLDVQQKQIGRIRSTLHSSSFANSRSVEQESDIKKFSIRKDGKDHREQIPFLERRRTFLRDDVLRKFLIILLDIHKVFTSTNSRLRLNSELKSSSHEHWNLINELSTDDSTSISESSSTTTG